MPYEGEFAGYKPLQRITESRAVQHLLQRARAAPAETGEAAVQPRPAPPPPAERFAFVVGVDASYAEVGVRSGYPEARVGYVTVASVLIHLAELHELDAARPVDPARFREAEQAGTIDAALPGANVVTRSHAHAAEGFREAVFETFQEAQVDDDDPTPLLETFEHLLGLKPQGRQSCPYAHLGCERGVTLGPGTSDCGCAAARPLYSTDALRVHERFSDLSSNGEAFGLVAEVAAKVLVIHLLRCFERRGMMGHLDQLALVLDGPLAVFGPPAWLSAAMQVELQRLNALAHRDGGGDLMLLGVEKTGAFVTHFEEADRLGGPDGRGSAPRFAPRTYLLPTDAYIKRRVVPGDSPKRFGRDTYFGRKLLYKAADGSRLVVTLPFLTAEQDSLDTETPEAFPRFAEVCGLLDGLASNRYPNALTPLVAAHAEAAIPLRLGQKVLTQLARALMRRS